MSSTSDFVARNAKYAASHQPLPLFSELEDPTTLKTVVVSCADPRVWPEKFLDLNPGDAIVFRVIGGRSGPVLHEISVLDSFLGGQLSSLMIVHHTDCGASHFTSESVKKEISAKHPGIDLNWETGSFEGMSDDEIVRIDIDVVKKDLLLTDVLKENVKGFVFDLKTGLLREVN